MFKIVKKEYLANNIWLMDIEAPRVAKLPARTVCHRKNG